MNSQISYLERSEDLMNAAHWDGIQYALVESPAAIEWLSQNQFAAAGEYDKGVAFGPDAELRWQKRNGAFHLVYISDSGQTLPDVQGTALEVVAEDQIYLWGLKAAGEDHFLEGRIPRTLQYPNGARAKDGKRMAVRIRKYRIEISVPEFTATDVQRRCQKVDLFRIIDVIPTEHGDE